MAGQLILFKLGISCVGLAFAAARTNWIRNDKREHKEADWQIYWASDVVHCRVYSGVGDGEHKVGERKQIIYYYFQDFCSDSHFCLFIPGNDSLDFNLLAHFIIVDIFS